MSAWKAICLSWLVMAGTPVASRRMAAGSPKGWVNSLKPSGRPGSELTLASGGRTDCVLVLPAQPTTQEEKAAAGRFSGKCRPENGRARKVRLSFP